MPDAGSQSKVGSPLWLLCELTYRCPLHCLFCSNPIDYTRHNNELATDEWIRVLREAREIGAVQLGFSGGEPLKRDDLETLVGEAHKLGYYSNLITSGVGLDEKRAFALRDAGLDHVQLSFQDSTKELNDFLSHTKTFELKMRIAKLLKAAGYPIVLNVVIHRQNIDHVDQILEMAARLEVDFLELANVQYYGWAFLNRQYLLPTRDQIARAGEATNRFRDKYGSKVRVYFVVPDYYENRPKKCMNGWGAVFLVVAADGLALPCHQARMLPGIDFPDVRRDSIKSIWYDSPAFNRFRGFDWMKEPCRECPEREKELGGCRCQAYLLTGDPANTDPVCERSSAHSKILQALAETNQPAAKYYFRDDKNSRELSAAAEEELRK
ncbi:MAG TPA: pyrroloquinoline quinone biosynthesis protein PqqE [Candidatus Binataceae bacterium]|nr:pyrroloquinoline quinone biosynthesis protein PqqE [Candidatus Binataceae bacterium]